MRDLVECTKGLPCEFTVTFEDGVPARYTEAKFQVRDEFDETLDLRLSATLDDGEISIDHGTGVVTVEIGATKTEEMEILRAPRLMAAELRLYDPTNDDDRMGSRIPFVYLPEVIND